MEKARKIKGLISQVKILRGDLQALDVEIKTKKQERRAKHRKIQVLQKEIDGFNKNSELNVSEHAMLRYIERVLGMDLREIELKILTPELSKMVDTLGGSGKYPVGNMQVTLKNNTVVSITNQ